MIKYAVGVLLLLFAASRVNNSRSYINKPIALVEYNDMIYHCEGVIKTKCGHTLHCGDMSVHCVTDINVEYLR